MKNYFFNAICLLLVCSVVKAQNLQNSDFEQWDDVGGVYEEPSGYWTTNNLISDFGIGTDPFVYKETEQVQSGSFAAKITSGVWGNLPIGGFLGVGEFAINVTDPIESYIEGKPYTDKPSKLSGYFKYFPVDGDYCDIYTVLTKYNSATNETEIVGYAGYSTNDTISEYTYVSIDFEYESEALPDSMFTVFTSSRDAAPPAYIAGDGSTLYVDNFTFEFATGINIPIASNYEVNVFPNPSTDFVSFSRNDNEEVELLVYSNDGKLVYNKAHVEKKINLEVSSFETGIYFYQIKNKVGVLNGGSFQISNK